VLGRGDGKVTTNFTSGYDYADDVAIQTDLKIVAAGAANTFRADSTFALARYNTDGTLDTAFSGDGKVATNFTGGGLDYGVGVALQPSDGNIVVAGPGGAEEGSPWFVIWRPERSSAGERGFELAALQGGPDAGGLVVRAGHREGGHRGVDHASKPLDLANQLGGPVILETGDLGALWGGRLGGGSLRAGCGGHPELPPLVSRKQSAHLCTTSHEESAGDTRAEHGGIGPFPLVRWAARG
jgi:hypothetical protein